MIKHEDFDIYFIEQNSAGVSPEAYPYYQEALDCFQISWDGYAKYKGITTIIDYQQELAYADEIMAIFHHGQCVAMMGLGHPDLNKIDYHSDSFLTHWDPQSIETLIREGRKIQTLTKLGRRPGCKMDGPIEGLPHIKRWSELLVLLSNGNLIERGMSANALMINEESGINNYYEGLDNPPIRLSVSIPYYGVSAKVHFAAIYASEARKDLFAFNNLRRRIRRFPLSVKINQAS